MRLPGPAQDGEVRVVRCGTAEAVPFRQAGSRKTRRYRQCRSSKFQTHPIPELWKYVEMPSPFIIVKGYFVAERLTEA